MKFDSVFLLPLLAVAFAILFRVFKKHPNYSKSIKSRKHRKIILGRFVVFVLPLAAAVSLLLPFQGLSKLATASTLSAMFLIPAYLAHLYMTRLYGSMRKHEEKGLVSDLDGATDESSNSAEAVVDAEPVAQARKSEQEEPIKIETGDLPEINLTKESYATNTASISKAAVPSLLFREPAPTKEDTQQVDGVNSPAEVQEQLDRVSDHIESHDLGNSDYSLSDEDHELRRFSLKSDVPLAIESALATIDMSANELSKMSSHQISELVTTLRTDKTKLQKLVIAQQASIDSERKAHDQSRTVARDAIKIMRDARNGQKMAEKLARRERTERKRVEQQYKKVASALNNAMSIIEARKAEAEDA